MAERPENRLSAIYNAGIQIVVPILLAGVTAAISLAWNHEGRLTTIEATQYTERDASRDQQTLRELISDIRANLKVQDEVNKRLDERMSEMNNSMSKLVSGVEKLNAKIDQVERR